jgi:hypothetical protein
MATSHQSFVIGRFETQIRAAAYTSALFAMRCFVIGRFETQVV